MSRLALDGQEWGHLRGSACCLDASRGGTVVRRWPEWRFMDASKGSWGCKGWGGDPWWEQLKVEDFVAFVWSDSFSVGGLIPGLLVLQEHENQMKCCCISAVFSAHTIKIHVGRIFKTFSTSIQESSCCCKQQRNHGDFPTNRSFIHYSQETLWIFR